MKNHYLFPILFFCFSFSFSQTTKAEKADELASQKNYADEIELRKEIMSSLEDTLSDAYKEQAYKTKLAKSFLTIDLKKWLALVEGAIDIFETMEKQSPEGKIILNIEYSNILIGNGQLEKALKVGTDIRDFILALEKATGIPHEKELATILPILANAKWFLRDYDGAIALYKKTLEKTKALYGYYSMETAQVHGSLALVNTFTFDLNATLDHAEKVVEIYEKIQPKNKFILYRQYFRNFTFAKDYGDLEKLNRILKKMEAYYEENKNDPVFINTKDKSFPNFKVVEAMYLSTHLQYASTLSDSAKTEHFYKLLHKEIPEGVVSYTRREKSFVLNSTMEAGRVFHNYGNHKKAKKYYSDALRFSEKADFSYGQLQAFLQLSTLGVDSKNWDETITYTEKAFQHPDFEKYPYPAKFYHNLGKAYFGKNDYGKAANELNKVLEIYSKGNANANYYGVQNLNGIGHVFLKMHLTQPQKKYIEKAYSAYKESSKLLSEVYRGGKYNDRLSSLQNSVNNGLLSCALILDQYQGEVVKLIEMNNSDHLWSNFLRNQKDFSVDPLHLDHQLDSLLREKESIAKNIVLAEAPTQKDSLTEKLENTKSAIASIHQKMKESEEAYYRFSHPTFQLQDFQSSMQPGEMAIRYIVADSLVFAYGITKNSLELVQLPTTKDSLYKKTNTYLSNLKNIQENYREQAGELHTVLIAPMKPEKHEQVTFVTDGFLSYLPFETLIGPGGSFFVQEHSVSYASSLELWSIQKNLENEAQTNMGIFSPEYEPMLAVNFNDSLVNMLVRAGNYELVGARTEAKNISKLFDGTLFMAEEASKTNFVENAADYDILHLAMHAVLNEKQPEKSNLIFNDNEKLYVSELYEMKIPAKLAVLSACNTGTGKIKGGEGVQSLSRAFTYAGVESTVRSLWPVPDRETSHIMTRFYQHLKDGQNKAAALRKAKLDYLKNTTDKNLQHPYYWAGFVVNGDVSPIASETSVWWYALGGIVVLGGILFFVRKRPKKA